MDPISSMLQIFWPGGGLYDYHTSICNQAQSCLEDSKFCGLAAEILILQP